MRQRIVLLLMMALGGCRAPVINPVKPANPTRFQHEITAMLEHDRAAPPAHGVIAFVGSSSIRKWAPTLREDMAPLPVENRGFGGAQTHDQLFYMDQVVLPLEAKMIVYYCGDNDLANPRVPAEVVVENFKQFCRRVWAKQPETKIFFLSIKPSPARLARWPEMRRANGLIREWCRWRGRADYIDLTATLLKEDGTFYQDRFEGDNLHVNRAGYQAWAEVLRPRLERAWERLKHR